MIETTTDPTLESLVPQPSTGRNVALVAAGALVLVGLWFGPQWSDPQVIPDDAGGSNAPVAGGVLASVDVAARGFGGRTLESVAPAPGAAGVEAWVVRGPDASSSGSLDMLPARLREGEHATLFIHWVVDDCTSLEEGYLPALTVRGALGFATTVGLPAIVGPEFDEATTQASVACQD